MLPLRLVVDTNFWFRRRSTPTGSSAQRCCSPSQPARLYVTLPILEEYAGVLMRPHLQIRKGERLRLLQPVNH